MEKCENNSILKWYFSICLLCVGLGISIRQKENVNEWKNVSAMYSGNETKKKNLSLWVLDCSAGNAERTQDDSDSDLMYLLNFSAKWANPDLLSLPQIETKHSKQKTKG